MKYNYGLTLRLFVTNEDNNDDELFDNGKAYKILSILGSNNDNNSSENTFNITKESIVPPVIDEWNVSNMPLWLSVINDRKPIYEATESEIGKSNTYKSVPVYVTEKMFNKIRSIDKHYKASTAYIDLDYLYHMDVTPDINSLSFDNNNYLKIYKLVSTKEERSLFKDILLATSPCDVESSDLGNRTKHGNNSVKEEKDKVPSKTTDTKFNLSLKGLNKGDIVKFNKSTKPYIVINKDINKDADETVLSLSPFKYPDKTKPTKKERQESYHYPDTKAFNYIMKYFEEHGVTVEEMAQEAMSDQVKHGVKAPLKAYKKAILGTLHKRDVDSLILVGLALDSLCTIKLLPEPLQSMMWNDAPAFSPDETLCELIGLQYSGIAVTNYGARDVHKSGLAKRIDEDESFCNVFLDDFVSVLIAVAEAKVAHKYDF